MELMKLKKMRKVHELTQLDVALGVGVSLMTYQLWERGANNPNPENLEKLERFFEEL